MNFKTIAAPFIALLFAFSFASVASAHVTVHPEESSTDAWEKYSVRIPVEKEINTTKVKLKVPDDINFVSVMPLENWDYELERDDNDLITSVTWTATDEGIAPNEFIEFYFVAANPSDPGEFSWEADQTYEDGSVVEWNGPEDADEPASITKVVKGTAVAQHGDDDESTAADTENDSINTSTSSSTSNNWLPISLSAIAILLAVISLFRKRS